MTEMLNLQILKILLIKSKKKVYEKTGENLELEIKIIGEKKI